MRGASEPCEFCGDGPCPHGCASQGEVQATANAPAVASDFDLPEPDRDHDPRDLDYWLRWEGE